MNFFEFISSVISSIAWPLVIGFVVWALKDELRSLMQSLRITKLKMKDFEAEFVESVRAVEEELSQPEVRRVVVAEPVSQSSQRLLDVDPNYAVLDSWKDLESRIIEVSVSKFENPRNWPVRRHILDLVKRDVLLPEVGGALEDLNHARNQIVHEKQFKLQKGPATKYIDLVADVIGFLNRMI